MNTNPPLKRTRPTLDNHYSTFFRKFPGFLVSVIRVPKRSGLERILWDGSRIPGKWQKEQGNIVKPIDSSCTGILE